MEPPAPQAQGVFAKTPFSNLLVYAMERRLSGTMELAVPDGRAVSIWFVEGMPAKARLSEGVIFLGDILVELGCVTDEQHQLLLTQNQVSGDLYGQALLAQGAISLEQLVEGLATQLQRKIEYVFSLPAETTFAYYDGYNSLEAFGANDYPQIDPLIAMWAGVRTSPPWEHVHQTLTRVGNAAFRLAPGANPERFGFGKAERAALDLLRQHPHRVSELSATKVIGPTAAQLLIYCLLITKQVELVEMPPSVRPPTASNAPPASVRPGMPRAPGALPQPGMSAAPGAYAGAPTPAPASPQRPSGAMASAPGASTPSQPGPPAIAKVQLKQSSVSVPQNAGAVTETIATNARDNRLATPPETPAYAGLKPPTANVVRPPNVGQRTNPTSASRIEAQPASQRTFAPTPGIPISPQSNSRMPISPGSTGSIPVAAGSTGQLPAASPSSASMTAAGGPALSPQKKAEYDAIRKKIAERAEKISGQNFFEMLGVKSDAKPEEVQKAYIIAAKEWHPDRLPQPLADMKDACGKVFAHISEANKTLTDPKRRDEYMRLLKDGGATPDDQAKIQAILEATTNFSKAEFYLKKNNLAEAEAMCRKAYEADPEQADYLAMLAWLESQKTQDKDQTRQRIAMLDKALKMNANCERAYFYRGMLHKRMDNTLAAVKDFKQAADLNPRNLDALREVRLYAMRKDPAGSGKGNSMAPGKGGDTGGGLFGKLFKK
jgi:curved DNA-binding protein CbpA